MQTYKISCYSSKEGTAEKKEIEGDIIGDFGISIDKLYPDSDQRYRITHVPSGRYIAGFWAKELAEQMINELIEIDGIDWSQIEHRYFLDLPKEKINLVKKIKYHLVFVDENNNSDEEEER